jgi:hypothetical protein
VYGGVRFSPQPKKNRGHVTPVGPRDVKYESKRFAESMLPAYRRQLDLDVPTAHLGPLRASALTTPERGAGFPLRGAGRQAAADPKRRQPDSLAVTWLKGSCGSYRATRWSRNPEEC